MRDQVFVRIHPQYIHFIGSIMEGYEHLGVVSTVRGETDMVIIRTTPDTFDEVVDIVRNLPFPFEIV